ncbi:DNA polymerase epsilon subunit 1 [Pleurostoma richardsiae]|uniref:DNA polymerase epsilon subunit 1 n=1 Tax=Pleurostoma richardsiae TaxID=41990 RepID=A0AA38RSW2_9PEZI|nr:DNA polymerase epsilon subunit 1 [Pleurostoma richardsiae]
MKRRRISPVPGPEGARGGLDKWGVFDETGLASAPSRLVPDDPISFNPLVAGPWAMKQLQFPSIEVSDFTCAGGVPRTSCPGGLNTRTATTGSQRTYSGSCSSVSSAVSTSRATFSPLNTDIASADGCTVVPSNWSRGPSPLSQAPPVSGGPSSRPVTASGDEYLCLAPQCDARYGTHDLLDEHVRSAHAADSFTCNWAECESAVFTTRDGLNWHVKAEHLLVCPVLGCRYGAGFQSQKLLESHIRAAHPNEKGPTAQTCNDGFANLGGRRATCQAESLSSPQRTLTLLGPERLATSTQRVDTSEERALKMTLSVATSKRRCREQLRRILDKRTRRNYQARTAQSPRSADTPPSRTPKYVETASFSLVWEHGVLPFLIEFIPRWCGPSHVISVTRGQTPESRRICIMTRKKMSRARKLIIAAHVRDLLPASYRQSACFSFSIGEVDRLVWARGLSREIPDDICQPRNPFYYTSPVMGDSIGTAASNGESTSTLGPCILVGGGSYWLANFHPFLESYQTQERIMVEHPSPRDRTGCTDEGHDTLTGPDLDFRVGKLTATSGLDLRTTRLSHDQYWEEMEIDAPLVVTDWSLISAGTEQANMLRKFPTTMPRLMKDAPVTATSSNVQPGSAVLSTGRTSGHQRGRVCEIPAYVSGGAPGNGTGRATREWFVEEPDPCDSEEAWIRGGIGVEGDSGAAIVDAETNALVGTLWGRNKYYGGGPRHAFFTPISDVFDDIQEKCGQQGRPRLPQYRDEGERYAVYPVCRPCFDLRTYLDSRRSSRESLRSMLGRNESVVHDLDHELTSVEGLSELATPKDHNYWLRHMGAEEAGMSFMNIVSPRPTGSSTFDSQGASPAIAEMRSPYAMNLKASTAHDT